MYHTVRSFLKDVSTKYKNTTALQIRHFLKSDKYSYADVYRLSTKIGAYLIDNNLKKGSTIMIWAPNMPEWALVLLGALQVGVVVVPVVTHTTKEVVDKYIKQVKPQMMFLSKYFPIDLDERSYPKIKRVYLEDILELSDNLDIKAFPHIDPSDLAEIVYTSGTTGDPKGVMLTHKNILYEIENLTPLVKGAKRLRMLSILPLSHIFEQIVGLFTQLNLGSTIYYLPRINPLTIKKALVRYKITHIALVPQIMKALLDSIMLGAKEQGKEGVLGFMLSIAEHFSFSVRRVFFGTIHKELGGAIEAFVVGSAPLNIEVAKTWELLGVKIIEGYGASETTGPLATNSFYERKLGSVGKLLPDVSVKFSADGEILIRGPNVMQAYYNRPDKTELAFDHEGYYRTGDVGYITKDGYLYLIGRSNFKIVTSGGDKIYPEDVERKISSNKAVSDSCVFGISNGESNNSEMVAATFILKTGVKKSSIEKIVDEINKNLEPQEKILEYFIWYDKDFPRLHNLKTDRKLIKEYYEGKSTVLSEGNSAEIETKDKLKAIINKVCNIPIKDIKENANLVSDFNLDSLRRVELVSLIEEELGVQLFETDITPKTNLSDIRKMVNYHTKMKKSETLPKWPLSKPIVVIREILRIIVMLTYQNIFISKFTIENAYVFDEVKLPAIFIFNHVGHADSMLVVRAMPRRIRMRQAALAGAHLYKNPFQWFLLYVIGNAFPLDSEYKMKLGKRYEQGKGGAVRETLEFAADLIEDDWNLIMSPEGKLSLDGKLGRFKGGIGMLAVELGVPVVPCEIYGYHELFTSFYRSLWTPNRRGEVRVKIGKPVVFSKDTSYEKAAKTLNSIMLKMQN